MTDLDKCRPPAKEYSGNSSVTLQMDIDSRKIKLAVLEQDYENLHDSLAASLSRRAIADLIDCCIVASIAGLLHHFRLSPWLAVIYFLARDATPYCRSIGKLVVDLRIYSANGFTRPTYPQLLVRGITNSVILVPIALLAIALMAISVFMPLIFVVGFWFLKDNPFIMNLAGYDVQTGRTVSDRIAGTYLLRPRDLDSIQKMHTKIEQLRKEISVTKADGRTAA